MNQKQREAVEKAALDFSQYCYCASPGICSGCENNTQKIFKSGAEFGYQLAKDELSALREKVERYRRALERLQSPQTGDWKKAIIEEALAEKEGE